MVNKEEQQQQINELSLLNRKIRYHRVDARARLEKMLDDEIQTLLIQQSIKANKMLQAGISKTKIGRAVGTTNWETINAMLALAGTDETLAEEISGVQGEGWSYDAATQVLKLTRWKNRHKNAMDSSRTLGVAMQQYGAGELEAASYREDVYDQGVDDGWFDLVLAKLNSQLGFHYIMANSGGVDPAELAVDFDRSVQVAAENREWEEDD